MGITITADPVGDYPWPLVLTLACDRQGCSHSSTIRGSDYIAARSLLTRQGWTERQDPRRFICPACSHPPAKQLSLFGG